MPYGLRDGSVGGSDPRVDDVYPVFVGKGGCVCPLPGCYSPAAVAEEEMGGLQPGGAEAVQEVCLACDDAGVDVCVAVFADVDLLSSVHIHTYTDSQL